MNRSTAMSWHEENQAYLVRALRRISDALEPRSDGGREDDGDHAVEMSSLASDAPPALERLCAAFGLSRFERDILLLCAGVELDAQFAQTVARAQRDSHLAFPSFSLALAVLPEPHWSALTPVAPLRRWRLIEVTAGETLPGSRIRIDERVLHYLAGVSYLDDRLAGLLHAIAAPEDLPDSQAAQAEMMVSGLSAPAEAPLPVIQICGDDSQSKRAVAALACAKLGLVLYGIRADAVPRHPAELDAFVRLWQREAVLGNAGLLIETDDAEGNDAAVITVLEELRGALFVSSGGRRHPLSRATVTLDIAKPTRAEQRALWKTVLGGTGSHLNGSVDRIAAQFNFNTASIRAAGATLLQSDNGDHDSSAALWESCRAQARARLDDLAERIVPAAGWDDLVLPQAQKEVLREIAVHVRQRGKVYENWGFSAQGTRGLGISALFSGPSGTGKTMAGEVLADELKLDLYRIDLSQVVNKYIGETEKNLRRVFDAAEQGGAILLFDEADALFGKRSEVKDSHDRYANIEVSYLLQKMEAYRGLAILTTNMKSALDTAFLRRIRFTVQFPFPDATQREQIWRRVFPAATPTEALDFARLARLQIAGGNIRNVAMNAAFLAAEADQPVRMVHLLQAAKSEYGKLERPLTEAEIGDWR